MDKPIGPESDRSRILKHLTRRQRLSAIEERTLDRDGDGKVTSRDLFLVHTGARLEPMPEIVPARRIVSRGDTLELGILGAAPKGFAAKLRTGGTLRSLDVEIKVTKRRTSAAIRLPGDVQSGDRVDADLWLTAPGYAPRHIGLVFGEPRRYRGDPQ